MRTGRALGLLVLSLGSLLTGCGSPSAHVGVLRLPLYAPFGLPDPARARTSSDLFLDSLLYSGLVKFSPDLHVIPELAVSIPTISDGARVYTFTIRQDTRFADGTHCTARDVAYSLTRALRVGSTLARHYLGGIEGAAAVESGLSEALSGVRVLHRLTLQVRLTQPDADFLEKLASPVAAVVNRRVVPSIPLDAWPASTAGTGPWVLRARNRDGTLTLAPRPHYYGGPLPLRSLVLLPVRDDAAGLAAYRKNAVDVARIPLPSVASLSNHADFHQSASLDAYYAVARSGDPLPLAQRLNRTQLSLALAPLPSIVPPAVPDYVPAAPSLDTGADPAAQGAPAVRIDTVTLASADAGSRMLRDALLRQFGSCCPGSSADEVSLRLIHASLRLPDPSVWLRLVLPQTHSTWYRASLAHAARLTNDPVTRMSIYAEMERWALQKGLIVPLASGTANYLIKPTVQSLQVTPIGIMPENNNWATTAIR